MAFSIPTSCIRAPIFIAKYASNGNFLWVKRIGSGLSNEIVNTYRNSLGIDSLNRIYILGGFVGPIDFDPDSTQTYLSSTTQSADIFLLRLDEEGYFDYVKHYPTNDGIYYEYNHESILFVNSENAPLIIGSYQFETDLDPGSGAFMLESNNKDFYALQLTYDGIFQWAKTIENTGSELQPSGTILKNDNIYVYGVFTGTTDFNPDPSMANEMKPGLQEGFIARYTTNGDYISSAKIGASKGSIIYVNGATFDELNNIYISGSFNWLTDFDPGPGLAYLTPSGNNDNFLLKLDSNFQFIWVKKFGDPGNAWGNYDVNYGIQYNPLNHLLYLTGSCNANTDMDPGTNIYLPSITSTGPNSFLSQIDTSGNLIWGKTISAELSKMKFDKLGNILLNGRINDTVDIDPGPGIHILNCDSVAYRRIFLKFTPFGDLVFGNAYDADISSFVPDSNNNYLLTGSFWGTREFEPGNPNSQLTSLNAGHTFILKLDSMGTFVWALQLEKGNNWPNSIELDHEQNIYVLGFFEDSIDMAPGPCMHTLLCECSSWAIKNGYLAKLNADGLLVWANRYVAHESGILFDYLHCDNSNNLYITSKLIVDSLRIETPLQTQTLINRGRMDMFIQKINQCPYYCDSSTYISCGPYPLNGNTYTQNGVYSIITGCDSITLLNLIVENMNNVISISGDTLFTSGIAPSYQWYDCQTQQIIPGATDSFYFLNGNTGNYAAIISSPNCSDTSQCFLVAPAATTDISKRKFVVYPNPVRDILYVSDPSVNSPTSYSIADAQGRIIQRGVISPGHMQIAMQDISNGNYILCINGSGKYKFSIYKE